MTNLLPIDELNNLESYMVNWVTNPAAEDITEDELVDDVLDILIIAYANGYDASNEMLGLSQKPDADEMHRTIYEKVAGKSFEDRIREYYRDGDLDKVLKVADTESHRIYNDGIQRSAEKSGRNLSKKWVTMKDEKVRDTHYYLEDMTVPLKEKFYTYDGDSAMYPGGFYLPENNINCRCVLELIPN